jgi:hypothetical protein
LLQALLLMALYPVRSERHVCERIDTGRLFRRFLDMPPSDDAFDPTAVTPNRRRLDGPARTAGFFAAVTGAARLGAPVVVTLRPQRAAGFRHATPTTVPR